MNAYELADIAEQLGYKEKSKNLFNIADMLRQQADRIAELEKELKRTKFAWNMAENEIERIASQTKPLSDETFTIDLSESWIACGGCGERVTGDVKHHCKPKPLSDEEIIEIRKQSTAFGYKDWSDSLSFARAIEERHGIK